MDLAQRTKTLTTLNEEVKGIINLVKSLNQSGLLIKSASETIETEAEEQKGEFLNMLLCTLGASLLGNLLVR